jgi:hypothetical protein
VGEDKRAARCAYFRHEHLKFNKDLAKNGAVNANSVLSA